MARLAIGGILLWSGGAKLADRRWPGAAAAWGVPSPLAVLVAPAELVLGALLVTGLFGRAAAFAALALLVAYTALVVVKVMGTGDAPPCACFGGLTARPVSWATVVRNFTLVVLAGLAAAG